MSIFSTDRIENQSRALNACILVFLRMPCPGRVKTRLAAHIGDEAAASLYRRFVAGVLGGLNNCRRPIIVCVDPPAALGQARQWLGIVPDYRPQEGAGLGERMKKAFDAAFERGHDAALLIGTDIPDLPPRYVTEALEKLEQGRAVVGPSRDGGYYLIGFPRAVYEPRVFGHLPWGSAQVCELTVRLAARRGLYFHMLPSWQDVDTFDDLLALRSRRPGLWMDIPGRAVDGYS